MDHDPSSSEGNTSIIPHVTTETPEQVVVLDHIARQCYNLGVAHGMAQAASAAASYSAKRARIYASSFEQFLAQIHPSKDR